MPTYGFMLRASLDGKYISDTLATNRMVGVPYSDEMITEAKADFATQADPNADTDGLLARYPGANVRNFDGQPGV